MSFLDASNVGFIIDNLPIAKEAMEFSSIYGLDPYELSLYGGEEYELIVTIDPNFWEESKRLVEKSGGSLIKIGVTTKEKR